MKRGLKVETPNGYIQQRPEDARITPMKRGLKAGAGVQGAGSGTDARITPMKRGLKEVPGLVEAGRQEDARITPMKRGLKDLLHLCSRMILRQDARITPMKRGLKASDFQVLTPMRVRCKDYPDEKGTERRSPPTVQTMSPLMQGLPR